MKLQVPLCLLALLLALTSAGFADDAILTPEMVVDLALVDEVALAPDGNTVAYTLEVQRGVDDEPGNSYKQLWLAAGDDGEPRRFTAGKERVGSLRPSPPTASSSPSWWNARATTRARKSGRSPRTAARRGC